MVQRLRQACVIGAGIAGLCCALAAASRGLVVQVFDDAAQPRAVPAHIDVVPGMLRDLVAFGVADECVRAGFPYHGIDVIDRQGRHVHELPTQRLAGPRYPAALGMRHADLHRVLEQAASARGVVFRRGVQVQAVQQDAAGRSGVLLHGGERVDCDLVVLAAGAGSALPMALFPHVRPAAVLPQAWWYALVRRPVNLDRPLVAHGGAGRRAVLVPVRQDLAGLALTEPLAAPAGLASSGLASPGPASPGHVLSDPSSAEHLRHALTAFAPRVRALAPQLGEGTPITLRQARCGLLEAPWHHGAVLAVGDCAHALPPHFGQAAAQAVEDARVLADLLDGSTDLAELFDAFQQRRAARVRQVFDITTTAARWDLQPDGAADLSLLMQRLADIVAQPA